MHVVSEDHSINRDARERVKYIGFTVAVGVLLLLNVTGLFSSILGKYAGGPVGLNTIAASVGEDASTIEEVYEPYLMQLGFLDRTPRGRVGTRLAFEYFRGGSGRGNRVA